MTNHFVIFVLELGIYVSIGLFFKLCMVIKFLLAKLWLITHLFSNKLYLHSVLDKFFLTETFFFRSWNNNQK